MFPSVHDSASRDPVLSNVTCLTARVCSLRVYIWCISLVFTTLTAISLHIVSVVQAEFTGAAYSLATATQFPSGLNARSRTGSEVLTSISSNFCVSIEYLLTVPSSDPAMKNPFYTYNEHQTPNQAPQKFTRTLATMVVLFSCTSSTVTGSSSDPVLNMRQKLSTPAVINFLPFGVYVRKVAPAASRHTMRFRRVYLEFLSTYEPVCSGFAVARPYLWAIVTMLKVRCAC